jgi:hypothetical protein
VLWLVFNRSIQEMNLAMQLHSFMPLLPREPETMSSIPRVEQVVSDDYGTAFLTVPKTPL